MRIRNSCNFSVLLRKHYSICEKRTEPVLSGYGQVGLAIHCNKLPNQLDHAEKEWVPCVFRKQSGVLSW